MGIATLLVESASLCGIWAVVFLVLCVLRSPGQTIILGTMSHVQVRRSMTAPGTHESDSNVLFVPRVGYRATVDHTLGHSWKGLEQRQELRRGRDRTRGWGVGAPICAYWH